MAKPAKAQESMLNGDFGDFFDSARQDEVTETVIESVTGVEWVPVKEAAHILDLSERSIWRRRWWPMALVWGASLGFLLISAIGSPDPAYRFYSEVNYWPLMIFVALPFVWEVVPAFAGKRWLWGGILVFFALRLGLITLHHQPYTARVDWLQERLANCPSGDRFILPENAAPMDTLLMSWGTPFETFLMSASRHADSAKTILITPEPQRYEADRSRTDVLLNTFRPLPLDGWAHPYGRLSMEGAYQYLTE